MGFEPTFAFAKTVFKTVAIVHSATPPKHPSIENRISFGKLNLIVALSDNEGSLNKADSSLCSE